MGENRIVARRRADRREEPFPDTPLRAMAEEAIEAAALSDPDAQPLTEEQFARARRMLRRKPS